MPTNCGYRCVDGFDVGADEPYWNMINAADLDCPEHGEHPLETRARNPVPPGRRKELIEKLRNEPPLRGTNE